MRDLIGWLGPDRVFEAYGGTERIGGTLISGREWLEHPGSVGKPTGGRQIRILDEDGGALPPGEIGEVFMMPPGGRGSTYRYIGADARATSDGWETLGDLGYLDADGFLYLVDRRTDMIVTGGANVYPAEVEAALAGASARALVRGDRAARPDLGQRVHAIVEAEPPLGDAELREHLAQHLARGKHPRTLRVRRHAAARRSGQGPAVGAARSTSDARMTAIDPRTPVLVGCGQVKQRCDDPRDAQEPLALMAEAAERAADDAGSRALLRALDSIRVPHGLWQYSNPAALLRERFECAGAQTASGSIAGSTVQRMLAHAASRSPRAAATWSCWSVPRPSAPSAARTPPAFRSTGPSSTATDPTRSSAIRRATRASASGKRASGRTRRRRSRCSRTHCATRAARRSMRTAPASRQLWSRFSQVAARNPYAWIQKPMSADEIGTPSEVNRLISFPYTKYLVSNMVVDLGAALLLCSAEAARRHGIPESRWIFPHACTDVFETTPLGVRASLHDQAAIRAAGRRALELAGTAPEQVAHVDLYSCFPAAVQIAAAEVGIPADRDLTVTGGLTFSGGPFNSYVMHSLATLVLRLARRSRQHRSRERDRRVHGEALVGRLLECAARGGLSLRGRDRPGPVGDRGLGRGLHGRGHGRSLHAPARARRRRRRRGRLPARCVPDRPRAGAPGRPPTTPTCCA
jgi:acetyl-CoA C-acetyltransferase